MSTGGRWRWRLSSLRPARGVAREVPGESPVGGPGRTGRVAGRSDHRGPGPHRPAEALAADRHQRSSSPSSRWRTCSPPPGSSGTSSLTTSSSRANATGLLATGGVIWATNVIAFGLWYWDLDRGGAAARAHHPHADPAFVFPRCCTPSRAGHLGAAIRRLPVTGLLDRHRFQPHRRLRGQAVGQAAHDDRSDACHSASPGWWSPARSTS